MAVVSTAAAAQELDRRQHVLQNGVISPERDGIALVELLSLVKFSMTQHRCVHPQPANALKGGVVVLESSGDMRRMRAVEHEELCGVGRSQRRPGPPLRRPSCHQGADRPSRL